MYLTPASIGYLTQFILALTIMGYFGYRTVIFRRRGEKPMHTPLLAAFFASVAVIVLLFFLDAALLPSPRLYAVYLENTAIGLFLTLLTQFAYRFPHLYPQRKWEARIVLALNLCYTLWEAGFAVYRGRLLLQSGIVMYRPIYPDYALVACFLWVPLAFLRQTIAASRHARELPGFLNLVGLGHLWRPQGQAARAVRAFALLFLIPVVLSLLNVGRATFGLSPAVFQSGMSVGILLTQILFVLVYLNYTPEMTTFQVRLVGIALVIMLAVFGAAGWVMTPPHAAVYRPALADRQTLRFTPNAGGGYDVMPAEFHFDADMGSPLDLRGLTLNGSPWEEVADIPFTFPFYGRTARTIWVMQSGAVGVDAPVRYPDMEYHYATTPAIFPLFVALDSADGGVFARHVGERLTITWYRLPAVYNPQAVFTFQLVLHGDGVFEITTNGLPDLPYDPNAGPFANAWVVGASPGTPGRLPQLVNFAAAPLRGGPQGIVQDHYLELRRHVHQLLLPLAILILVSSLVVVAGFPLAFYLNLIRPLNALVAGVRRVEAGDLETVMPVQYHDEIGFLTQVFNNTVARLRELIAGLEAQVAARTQQLERQNAELIQRNEELDAFAHTVAHDIKGPLSILVGYAELLEEDYQTVPENMRRKSLQVLVHGARDLVNIVDELLLLASVRKTDVIPEPLEMGSIVHGACRRLAYVIQEHQAEIILPSQWPTALGHAPWVEEVWVNYLSNGCKYGGKPPRLELGWDRQVGRSASQQTNEDVPGSFIRFWVRDNGDGISPDEQARLFVPFTRLGQARAKGHGLGLSIVRRIVERLGGQVGVESDGIPGHGSLFYFTLLAAPDPM